ncbi:creatininase family protein [Cohnella zeiphila]|uniref:Creatininase family protein n=1 Tax=Cohnella zeiphila TaxID=2761120 RepID=A0A7X0SL57_9BACL|nr:creatininase family protein [Cohnella zeiphila]MBB6732032.1 creatininase family protein [Cohnella zeiphila]
MFIRYEGAAWEERFLPRLTSKQIRELPKDNALVILPIGAVEQHGPHLPVMTDALIGEATLTRAMELLSPEAQAWLLPPIAYGKSNEHLGLPGTVSISAATLQGLVMDIAASLKLSGFGKLLLFNTHGGNVDLLNVVSREIRIVHGMTVFYLSPSSLGGAEGVIDPEEMEYGIHGGDYETSIVMAIKPGWVQSDCLVSEVPAMGDKRFLTLEGRIRFAWRMADISASGICGDATKATAAKGEIIQGRVAGILAEALTELCEFDVADVRGAPEGSR